MATTVRHSIPASGAWVEVADGSASVTVQLASTGRVLVYVGESQPSGGTTDGFLLSSRYDMVFAATGLAETDKVFARALGQSIDQSVVVMAT